MERKNGADCSVHFVAFAFEFGALPYWIALMIRVGQKTIFF